MNQPEKLDGYITVKSPAGNLKLSGELAALKWGVDAIDSGRREEIIREAQSELIEVLEREVSAEKRKARRTKNGFSASIKDDCTHEVLGCVLSILNQHKK